MNNYINASYKYIMDQKHGNLLNNLLKEPAIAGKFQLGLIQFVAKSILCIAFYTAMILINWQITLVLTVIAGMILLIINGISKKYATKKGLERIDLSQRIYSMAGENIAGYQLIKSFSFEEIRQRAFKDASVNLRRLELQFALINSLPTPLGEVLIVFGLVIILVAFTSLEPGKLRTILPALGTVMLISQRLFTNLSDLVRQRLSLLYYWPSVQLVHSLAHEEIELEEAGKGVEFVELEMDIKFKDLCFSYNKDTVVLKDVNLVIPKGKMTAVIGPSGIGKTTIADLVIGLLEPTTGEIVVNGRSLQEYNLRSWRNRLGYVSQDTVIFNTSVKENIRIGKIDAGDEEIENAAKGAAIFDFVMSLPRGFQTEVGDRGVKLSGGQRQRIAIARAILRDPDLYIFDEATSALDHESERLIQKSIEEVGQDKTVLVIAHRLSTIENADVVYDVSNFIES
jgi:subfamily B ATP-binding cassette protein MsbA